MNNQSELRNAVLDAMGGRTRGNRDLLSAYLDAIDEVKDSRIEEVAKKIQSGTAYWISKDEAVALVKGLHHDR